MLCKISHASYAFNSSQMSEIFLYFVHNWQNYSAFNHGNLTFWRYQKLSHNDSVQDKRKHGKCELWTHVLDTANVQNGFPSLQVLSEPLLNSR